MNAIEITSGKVELLDGQTITLAEDATAADVSVFTGNGTYNVANETFTIAGLAEDSTVKFAFDTNHDVEEVIGFDKDSTITIDGTTYTAPEEKAILHYDDEDSWYFDGSPYSEYTVTVDANGNVKVAPGMKFSDVISSGKTLAEDGSIKFAADISKTPVTVTNENNTSLTINDKDENTWTENFGKSKVATFSGSGVKAETLEDVAGTAFYLQNTQSLTAGDTKVTANANDSEVGVGTNATSLSLNKGAQIEAPEDIELTLNAGNYEVNGVKFTGNGTTSATTTADGVKLDLATSDPLTYDYMTLSSAGTATIDNAKGVTLTGGAVVENAEDRALTVDGTAILDDKIINSTEATEITTTSSGFNVGERKVTITGDEDGYIVNLSENDVSGLENIGSGSGVTVDGLNNATLQTDKAGSLTADDKTFEYDNASVLYGFRSGAVASISGANFIIGDFTDNVRVNGDNIKVVGESDSAVSVTANSSGVSKIEVDAAGTYAVSGKTYEIQDDDSFAFNMSGGSVTGISSVESGTLIISQNEKNGFKLNNDKITLSGNRSPVTLGIVDSTVASVSGVDGTINGLGNATVYGFTSAVINDKLIDISNSGTLNAIVESGVASKLIGLTDGSTVNSAPNMRITTAENGTFTFVTDEYSLEDTLDATFDFLTNIDSRVAGIDKFAGSLSGGVAEGLTINGDSVKLIGENLIIETDGEKITNISGLEDGGEISGDFGDATLKIPEGESTVNGVSYILEGDEGGASLSGNGSIISGMDKDSTLTFGASGTYEVDGKTFEVTSGDALTVNRDGVYKINPDSPPISEKSKAEDILARSENSVYVEPTESSAVDIDLTGDNDLALIDSPNANVNVTAGAGNDSVVVRHGAAVDVDLNENGETLIIPTAGRVTLENYNGDNAAVQTFEYSDVIGAVKSNEIKFGDGTMTLGDAVVTYDPTATDTGSVSGKLLNAQGEIQAVAFTNTAGGTIDKSDSTADYLMKGNYAENSDDTQKSGGSTIKGGSGNDTILAGAGDSIDAGGGYNQIYLTDESLRKTMPEGATIVMGENSRDTVHNFSGGFDSDDDKVLIKDFAQLGFGYGTGDLVMSSEKGQITFENLPDDTSAYELKITDGTNDYNAAIAKENEIIDVTNGNEADIFFGNEQGISFSEYTGAVEINLNEGGGTLDGRGVMLYNIDKVEAGAGNSSLIGAADTPNTLIAGTGSSSIWSNSGRDLMVGNTSDDKNGSTTFFYMPNDGRDSIENFDFMTGPTDTTADYVQLDDLSGVTNVFLRGDDVVIGINNSADDYLTIADAKGKSFRLNDDLIAKVDTNVEFDGFTNCYVGTSRPSTLTVGDELGDVAIWLSDDSLEYHGIMYDGDFEVLDASAATGQATLAGNEFNNLIIGGAGANSIWGGYAASDDTLVGGAGRNTFFFAAENGHDVIQNAHDGDFVSLEDIFFDDIVRADITDSGAFIELQDGSSLNIQSTANLDYRLQDGTTYTANRSNREWVQK